MTETELTKEQKRILRRIRYCITRYNSSPVSESYSILNSNENYSVSNSITVNKDQYDESTRLADIKSSSTSGRQIPLNLTFTEKLIGLMQEKNLSAPDVYKPANIDKTLFSKIIADRKYKPSKDTAISIAFGLKLNLKEAKDLIDRAGYSLTHSIDRDIAIECCFKDGLHDIAEINIILNELDFKPLGRQI